jgi:hypothetical protein
LRTGSRDSTLIGAREIEGLFNEARDGDYAALSDAALSETRSSVRRSAGETEEKLSRHREINLFDAPKARVTESQLGSRG